MRWSELVRDRRGLVFAVPAGALAVLVLVAAFNMGGGEEGRGGASRLQNAESLLAPARATEEELDRASGGLADQTAVSLAGGAWIQVADETGRLAQQYSATRLEPLAGRQLSMTEPRAIIYLSDGRVLTLGARRGVAFVPSRALESGTLEDDVVVRLYRPRGEAAVDVESDAPAVVVTADHAQFDGVLGEVRCDRAVRVATDIGRFAGEGLTLYLDGEGDGIERLVVERALEPIRIDRAARRIAGRRGVGDARTGESGRRSEPPVNEGASRGSAASAGRAPDDREEARFYRLVLDGGVEIVRTRDGVESTIRGDELEAVFSLDGDGLDTVAAHTPRPAEVPAGVGAGPAAGARLLAPLAMTAARTRAPVSDGDRPSDEIVTVAFGGRLVMQPLLENEPRPASRDEILFDVVGRSVEIFDGRSATRVVGTRLHYEALAETVEVEGDDSRPLAVVNARMSLEAARFRAAMREGLARIDGAGRIDFAAGGEAAADAPLDPTAERFEPGERQLAIAWSRGVDLEFAGAEDAADLRRARFEEAVRVEGRQFEPETDALAVAFAPDEAERIESIIAEGGTTVRRLGALGGLRADRLELELRKAPSGEALPKRLVALRAVEAADDRQTVWTEDLVVTFRERSGPDDRPAVLVTPAEEGGAEAALDGIEIDTVRARGGVEVLLKEGARVFADSLEGDAAARRLGLSGEDVAIVRSNVVADGLRQLRFDEASRRARSEGPGRFRAFADPVVAATGRVGRPSPGAAPSMTATWSDSLEYSENEASRGRVDIRGAVRMRSTPSLRGSDAVDADRVVLELGVAAEGEAGDDASRSLDRFIAEGDARLESRAWEDEAHTGDPRVFRVTGPRIEYDLVSREGLVEGEGAILVNMPAVEAGRPESPGSGAIDLGGDGTTRFRWTRRMALEHRYDDVFAIEMEGGVEVLHAGLRPDDTLSMRCDALEATVLRPAPGDRAGGEAPTGADLGGPADLLGLRASGTVFIRTPDQDIECGEFDYSVETGIAILRAAEGRAVAIAVRGQPTPIRADEVRWDLRNGRLQVTRMSGAGAR